MKNTLKENPRIEAPSHASSIPARSERKGRLLVPDSSGHRSGPSNRFPERSAARPARRQALAQVCGDAAAATNWQERLATMLNHSRREAEALAATTPFPQLFLPCLLEEKTDQARQYAARQLAVWKTSRDILCLSA